jgi:hypothetical protein
MRPTILIVDDAANLVELVQGYGVQEGLSQMRAGVGVLHQLRAGARVPRQ